MGQAHPHPEAPTGLCLVALQLPDTPSANKQTHLLRLDCRIFMLCCAVLTRRAATVRDAGVD